jgi:hypothetical protein
MQHTIHFAATRMTSQQRMLQIVWYLCALTISKYISDHKSFGINPLRDSIILLLLSIFYLITINTNSKFFS